MELAKHVWRRLAYQIYSQPTVRFKCDYTNDMNKIKNESSSIDDRNNSYESLVLNTVEELTCFIGLAREFACESSVNHPYVDKLKRVQMILFDLNHAISQSGSKKTIKPLESKHTKDLEEWIAEYANQLPPPEDFIIPGGGKASASLHVARTICKRTETSVIPLINEGILDKEAKTYLSRLSEFLFTASRIAAKCDQRSENIYIPRAETIEDKSKENK